MRRVRDLGLRESARQAKAIVAESASSRFSSIRDRYFNSTAEDEADRLIRRLFRQTNFVDQLKSRPTPIFFLDQEPEFYCKAIRAYFPDEEVKIIAAADRIKDRVFDLLGSGPKD